VSVERLEGSAGGRAARALAERSRSTRAVREAKGQAGIEERRLNDRLRTLRPLRSPTSGGITSSSLTPKLSTSSDDSREKDDGNSASLFSDTSSSCATHHRHPPRPPPHRR
jgi:hypothetical protein